MLDVYNDNIEYLKENCYDYEFEEVLNSIIIPNAYVYKFCDLIYELDIYDYVLYDIIKIDSIDKPVYVYSVDCDELEFACLSQSFYVPHVENDLDVHFVAFISNDIIEDEIKYKYILGHELAHIDLLHLDKYDDHAFQERYHLIEAYCDIKALDFIQDEKTRYRAYVNMMIEHSCDIKTYNYYYSVTERKIRMNLTRLYMKGKLTVEMLYNYIINNYDRHMKLLENYCLEYSDIINKLPNLEFKSLESKYILDYFLDSKRFRNCI